jgi:hypothetical protein
VNERTAQFKTADAKCDKLLCGQQTGVLSGEDRVTSQIEKVKKAWTSGIRGVSEDTCITYDPLTKTARNISILVN